MFNSQRIPKKLLRRSAEKDVNFRIIIDTLNGFALINQKIEKETYAIHSLVQVSVHYWLKQRSEKANYAGQALQLLTEEFPSEGLRAACIPPTRLSLRTVCSRGRWIDCMRALLRAGCCFLIPWDPLPTDGLGMKLRLCFLSIEACRPYLLEWGLAWLWCISIERKRGGRYRYVAAGLHQVGRCWQMVEKVVWRMGEALVGNQPYPASRESTRINLDMHHRRICTIRVRAFPRRKHIFEPFTLLFYI